MLIQKENIMTGEVRSMNLNVTQEQLDRIEAGELIQNVCVNLSADEREFLISGIMPGEWDEMFPDEEEEE